MTNEQINREIAEKVMGWTEATPKDPRRLYWKGSPNMMETSPFADMIGKYWNPSERIDHAWMMEEKIANLGLELQYVNALVNIVGTNEAILCESFESMWRMIHATPEERCLAALEAMKEE